MIYSADKTELAKLRFHELTGKSDYEFWLWLGANEKQLQNFNSFTEITLEASAGPHPKMEMLLNQHYKALMKAWQIRHDAGVEP